MPLLRILCRGFLFFIAIFSFFFFTLLFYFAAKIKIAPGLICGDHLRKIFFFFFFNKEKKQFFLLFVIIKKILFIKQLKNCSHEMRLKKSIFDNEYHLFGLNIDSIILIVMRLMNLNL